ncbi:thiol-disulfide oxidoreductase DCC family protein [Pseudoteredinibacter isoporae]|uniref:thiol-disulfide oxidoreductase DCC family protein n=1 Tax=Pseudoteredinibacter isoporae TaxID=570281 RepID=UPI00310757F3
MPTTQATELSIFFDGTCPLCVKEVEALKRLNQKEKLAFLDIEAEGFHAQYPSIDLNAARQILHGQRSDGSFIYGLDVSQLAWRLVESGSWRHIVFSITRWPVIRPIADLAYITFARNRYRISFLFTGKSRCENGHCKIR